MEYYKKAKEMMDMNATELIGGVSKNKIENAMKSLSAAFPESYKAFLADFGGGDGGGEIIFGITDSEEDDVVIVTQMERSQGLPQDLIVIGFWNDVLICLDTGKINNGECSVVKVNDDYRKTEVIADTFGKFLYNYLKDE